MTQPSSPSSVNTIARQRLISSSLSPLNTPIQSNSFESNEPSLPERNAFTLSLQAIARIDNHWYKIENLANFRWHVV